MFAVRLDGVVPGAFSVLRSIGRLWLCREGVCVMASLYETLSDAQQGEAIADSAASSGSRRSKPRLLWNRFCLPYPWVSSNRRRHPKV